MPSTVSLPGIWTLLTETAALLKTFPGHFFGYSGWLLVPVVLSVLASTILPEDLHLFVDLFLNSIVYILLALWATISMTLFAVRTMRQQSMEDTDINRQAWALLLPFAILSVSVSFLNLIGVILFIVPGVLTWVWFSFAATSFVVGDAGLGSSFEKSRSLSRGRFLLVFARLFQGAFLINLAYACFLIPIILLFSPNESFDLTTYLSTMPSLGEQLAYNGLDIIFLPISVAFHSVLYVHLTASISDRQETKNA